MIYLHFDHQGPPKITDISVSLQFSTCFGWWWISRHIRAASILLVLGTRLSASQLVESAVHHEDLDSLAAPVEDADRSRFCQAAIWSAKVFKTVYGIGGLMNHRVLKHHFQWEKLWTVIVGKHMSSCRLCIAGNWVWCRCDLWDFAASTFPEPHHHTAKCL